MKRNILLDIVCGLFIFLFVYTAVSKFRDLHSFRQVLSTSPLLQQVAPVIAWVLPVTELSIAALLFFPSSRKMGLYASLALMLVFTVYIAYMLLFTPQLPCSCGGVIKQLSWRQHFVFNTAWILLSLIGIWLYHTARIRTTGLQGK